MTKLPVPLRVAPLPSSAENSSGRLDAWTAGPAYRVKSVLSLAATSKFYEETERGRAHWADLQSFMDIEGSPTVVVSREVDVGPEGILQLFPPAGSAE